MGMLDRGHGMSNMVVTVTKTRLLEVLKGNRTAHEDEYKEALKGWHESVLDTSELLTESAKNGDISEEAIQNATEVLSDKPVSHVGDYDTAIEMLEWHTGEEMKIEREQFKMYILDQWRWKDSFSYNSGKYRR
jgi:hypothetical protein